MFTTKVFEDTPQSASIVINWPKKATFIFKVQQQSSTFLMTLTGLKPQVVICVRLSVQSYLHPRPK